MYQPLRDLFSTGKGVLRQAADRAFAPGAWSALPTAAVDFRGGMARTEGSPDALRWCGYDGSAYEWTLVPTLPVDPNADRIVFWDDSAGRFTYLTASTGLSISGTNLTTTGSAPALIFITSASPSGAASSSFDNCFSGTYVNYLVVLSNMSQSAAQDWWFRLRASSSDDAASNHYIHGKNQTSSGGTNTGSGSTGSNQWLFLAIGSSAASSGLFAFIVSRPFIAAETSITWQGSVHDNAQRTSFGGGYHNQATSYDGLTILPASGTISGTIRVYGISDS